ncbi:pyruvate kinase [Allofrancisella inopinata]|uniref:Pyruvate kinase n=1 Tax=Allofrancisella inopinata TaxID=1085647 RepID=A0AAE7CQA4_9GAMM|nr:pyruvate kinase [Allofrancisella inopinata]QIV95670.1 pyruvate kinase [Allofrancisella inopinata]TDT72126.1 pyruvate kinase [Allofrancisella inopinata]
MRRTKILATLGPASESKEVLTEMIKAGVNAVRCNFSHGSAEDHRKRVELIRQIAKEQDTYVGILADLQGPKIRLSKFKNGSVEIKKGQKFILDADLGVNDGDENTVGIDYKELIKDVKSGDILLVDDGKIVLQVESVKENKATTKVVIGGKVSNNKGINKKGGGLTAPALTDKDKEDIKIAAMLQVDFLAVSFVRDGKDMEYARQLVHEAGWKPAMVAKIERAEAVHKENLKSIIEASDLVMVARGDLAVEIGDENVPTVQKFIISTARQNEKGSITATQMMESMIENSSPTRAEASDVANAVFDGTDAVMLSAETAVGKYPVETVAAMSRICESAEKSKYNHIVKKQKIADCSRIDHAVSVAAVKIANDIGAKGLIVLTEGGNTSRWMSRINTDLPIYALSRNAPTLGAMTLFRGVIPIYFDSTRMSKVYVNRSASMELESRKLVKEGDILVLTSGDSMGVHGSTNKIKVIIAGQVR